MTHHPHVHMILPGGGLSIDQSRWISCRPRFFLPVRVLSRLFRRLFLQLLRAAHAAGRLQFFADHGALADGAAFASYLQPLRQAEWVVYAKEPFGGPQTVLAYLSRYTHRVAIANRRLLAADARGVTFKWKDYRFERRDRYKTMTLATHEFIRRFLLHVLPKGFHRIRHYGILANGHRAANVARARQLLVLPVDDHVPDSNHLAMPSEPSAPTHPCPRCGGRMVVIETFEPGATPTHHPQRAPPHGPSAIS
jgi:hypothetical protein